VLAAGLLTAGCTTVDGRAYWAWEEPDTDTARQAMLEQQALREKAMLKSQISGMDQAQSRLNERLDRLEAQTRENARLRDEIAALHRELDQVKSDREAMRKQIVDDLTVRINKFVASVQATATANRPPASVKQNGYMHTVAAGQKLTDIAKAYKTTAAAIRRANNLKNDTLKTGQTLFIPE